MFKAPLPLAQTRCRWRKRPFQSEGDQVWVVQGSGEGHDLGQLGGMRLARIGCVVLRRASQGCLIASTCMGAGAWGHALAHAVRVHGACAVFCIED